MSEWIDVKQQFPQDDGEYLVYPGWFGKPLPHAYNSYFKSWHHPLVSAGHESAPVTHWMRMPDPPASTEVVSTSGPSLNGLPGRGE